VTITASSNLTEDEIKRAVDDAEKFADEDKKHKDEVEIRNQADQMVYTTERSMREMGDKLDANDKDEVEKAVADLKKTLEGSDNDMIKTATEHLTEVSYRVFGKVYEQAAQQQQQQQYEGGAEQDADYEVVDDDK
jgi:molecular chaperone DnaK